jgi:hypothetical protein
MSAFGGKADMALCGNSLLRSLLGVKRTCVFAAHMSAFDPKQTSHRYGDFAERDVHVNVRTGFIQEIASRLGYGDTSESILLIDWLILYTQELTTQKQQKATSAQPSGAA